jgi:hypothetical protein
MAKKKKKKKRAYRKPRKKTLILELLRHVQWRLDVLYGMPLCHGETGLLNIWETQGPEALSGSWNKTARTIQKWEDWLAVLEEIAEEEGCYD